MTSNMTSNNIIKEAFFWTEATIKAFKKLKEATCTTLVLATIDFTKAFIVECDDSSHGIGAILMQEGRPHIFYSNQLKGKNLLKPIYEKEMLAILHAVKNWCPYLIK
jgi:hypothetical protein